MSGLPCFSYFAIGYPKENKMKILVCDKTEADAIEHMRAAGLDGGYEL